MVAAPKERKEEKEEEESKAKGGEKASVGALLQCELVIGCAVEFLCRAQTEL